MLKCISNNLIIFTRKRVNWSSPSAVAFSLRGAGRVVGEIALFVIPFAKIGKIGKLGRVADEVGDLGPLSKAAEQISRGHAFEKHVAKRGAFPGVNTPEQFAKVVEDVLHKGEKIELQRGRSVYWKDGTIVILDPSHRDGGTAFRPVDGYDYFKDMKGK